MICPTPLHALANGRTELGNDDAANDSNEAGLLSSTNFEALVLKRSRAVFEERYSAYT